MKQMNYKKLIIPNIPYVFFVYLFDKVGQAVRLAPGADISEKILNITQGFSEAFSNALPSVHPLDLLIGIVGAVVIRLIVYVKGKNAKKYRKGAEYGSARWGNTEDIVAKRISHIRKTAHTLYLWSFACGYIPKIKEGDFIIYLILRKNCDFSGNKLRAS